MDFVPVVEILDAPVLEQVIVLPLPEVQVVGRVARVRAPLVAVPVLAVSPAGLRDPTEAALEFGEDEEVEEEKELEMFDETTDRFKHSSWRPRRLCRLYMAGCCEDGWAARSRTANKSSTRTCKSVSVTCIVVVSLWPYTSHLVNACPKQQTTMTQSGEAPF